MMQFETLEYRKNVFKFCRNLSYKEEGFDIPVFYSLDLTIKERNQRRELVNEKKKEQKMVNKI